MPLTMYVARHAWANIARSKNVPLATISEAMGHDSENTTRIYLASLDTSQVDKANDIILNPYNGDGCGTQNTGQRLCRSCFSWQEKYYNVQVT
mgnify:CR=1 FL=1